MENPRKSFYLNVELRRNIDKTIFNEIGVESIF